MNLNIVMIHYSRKIEKNGRRGIFYSIIEYALRTTDTTVIDLGPKDTVQ